MSVRQRWHAFHGWSIARGIRPLELRVPEFLDLVFYFMNVGEYPDIPDETTPVLVMDDKVIPPPKWMGWKDTSASQEDMLAAWEARS